jgi:hypothetical protein
MYSQADSEENGDRNSCGDQEQFEGGMRFVVVSV